MTDNLNTIFVAVSVVNGGRGRQRRRRREVLYFAAVSFLFLFVPRQLSIEHGSHVRSNNN